jgi:hypothetical protein
MASRSSESFLLLSSKELAIPKTKIRKLKDKERRKRAKVLGYLHNLS